MLLFSLGAWAQVSSAPAPHEPFDLKGDKLGTDLADFQKKYQHSVRGDPRIAPFCKQEIRGLMECQIYFPFEKFQGKARETIANCVADITFHFVDGKLWRISATFAQRDFATVKEAFIGKIGQPKSAETKIYQNTFGASLPGELISWDNGPSTILLAERTRTLDGSAMIMEHTELSRKAKEKKPKLPPDV